jgi:hypothetical protein
MRYLYLIILLTVITSNLEASNKAYNHYNKIDKIIENLDTRFPKELIRAICWGESSWKQFSKEDINTGDYGVMQINHRTIAIYGGKKREYLIKNSAEYNIKFGTMILCDKYKYVLRLKKQKNWKKIEKKYHLEGMDNLSLAILAYNGFRKNHSYIKYIYRIEKEQPWKKLVSPEAFNEKNSKGST